MNNERIHKFLVSLICSLMLTSAQPIGNYHLAAIGGGANWWESSAERPATPRATPIPVPATGKSSAADASYNIVEEIKKQKRVLPWKRGPDIVPELCKKLLGEKNSNCEDKLTTQFFGLSDEYLGPHRQRLRDSSIDSCMVTNWGHAPDPIILISWTFKRGEQTKMHVFMLAPNGTVSKIVSKDANDEWYVLYDDQESISRFDEAREVQEIWRDWLSQDPATRN